MVRCRCANVLQPFLWYFDKIFKLLNLRKYGAYAMYNCIFIKFYDISQLPKHVVLLLYLLHSIKD